ncbi:hypothetical protein VYU27_007886 [Nannochloropsis oceanica]
MAETGADDDKDDDNKKKEKETEWVFVTSSKKGKSAKRKPSSRSSSTTAFPASFHQPHGGGLRDTYTSADIQCETTRLLAAVEIAKRMLSPTAFYSNLEHALLSRFTSGSGWKTGGREDREVRTLVCYGLGSIQSTDSHPLWQLACACLLKDRLHILLSSLPPSPSSPPLLTAEVYDPLFDGLDTHLLTLLGWHVLPHNEHGKRRALTPTVFFMPCCHRRLYSNLLWANWSPDCLQNVLLVGNRLRSYEERTLASEKEKDESDCILPLLPWMRETLVSWKRKEEEKGDEGEEEKQVESKTRSEREKEDKVVKSAFVDLCVTDFPNLPLMEGGEENEDVEEEEELREKILWKRRPPEHNEDMDVGCVIKFSSQKNVEAVF